MVVNTRKRGKYWEYRFEIAKINGKRRQISKSGFKTKKEASEEGNKALAEYNNSGQSFKDTDISVSDYLDFWFNEYVVLNLKYNTQLNYKGQIENHIKAELGKYKLSSLSPAAIQKFINNLKLKGLSKSTLTGIKATLSASLDYAVEPLQYISYNPCRSVKIPKYEDSKGNETRFIISKKDFSTILDYFDETNHFYIPLLLGYYCGFRIAETFALTWEDIDLDKATISINKTVCKRYHDMKNQKDMLGWYFNTTKTKSSNRVIKINKSVVEALKKEKKRQIENRLYYGEHYTRLYKKDEIDEKNNTVKKIVEINSNDNISLEEVNLICRKVNGEYLTVDSFKYCSRIIRKKLNIKFNYHSLRHTHTTLLLEHGASIKAVQKRLRHSNIDTTLNVYSHLTKKIENETVDIIEYIMIK